MQDQEKQIIEDMAKVIEITEQIARDAHCGLPSPRMYAKDLYWHGYRKQSGWISVEERLPEPNENCLVAVKVGDRVVMDLGERIRCIDLGNGESYYEWMITYDWGDDGEDCEITHWMPFPEPPKGGEG